MTGCPCVQYRTGAAMDDSCIVASGRRTAGGRERVRAPCREIRPRAQGLGQVSRTGCQRSPLALPMRVTGPPLLR